MVERWSWSRIKDGNGSMGGGEDGVRRTWKDYFEDLYNIETEHQAVVHM